MGDYRIKLGKVINQVNMGRFIKTQIESTLIDEHGVEIASAPLFTALDLNEIEVDENLVVTNAFLCAPDKDGKRCWLVKTGRDSGEYEPDEYSDDLNLYLDLDEYDEDFDDGKFGTE